MPLEYYKHCNTYLIECALCEQYGYDCPYALRLGSKDICTADYCHFEALEEIINNHETLKKDSGLNNQRNSEEA